ncbi:MAG: aminodeoxychorismate lyase [Sulfuricaulis sp.]
MTTLINGEPGESISVYDRGYQYGDGLFETLAVVAGEPLLWDRHMRRLFHGAGRLGIPAPNESLLRDEARHVCRGAARAVLKIIVTRGVSGRGYAPGPETTSTRTVCLLPWPDYPSAYRRQGVAVRFCRTMIARSGTLAGLKHLNRLEQVCARMELVADYAEGLMLDEPGHVIEGTMTNIFIVRAHELLTPDLSHSGVEGVMRGLVLERAVAPLPACRVATLSRDTVLNADEIFVTNSLIGLWPVRRIESKEFPVGPVTRHIQEAIRDACAEA